MKTFINFRGQTEIDNGEIKQYELTDGREVFKVRWLQHAAYQSMDRIARCETGGNLYWQPVTE